MSTNKTYTKHALNIFPSSPEALKELTDDMQAQGYLKDSEIILFEGAILDGWHRYQAATQIGIVPEFKEFEGTQEEAFQYQIAKNSKRRHLNQSQMAIVAAEARPIIEAFTKQNADKIKATQIVNGLVPASGTSSTGREPYKQKDSDRTTSKVAEQFGVNNKYVAQAIKIAKEDPTAYQAIKQGELTIKEHMKIQKTERFNENIAAQKIAIAEQNTKVEFQDKYDVLVLDPPWDYGSEGTYDPENMRIVMPYPAMSQEQLLAMDIPAKDDCTMFLWTTQKHIFDAKALLDHWGFEYKYTMVWDKQKMGMGRQLRFQCEFVLVGKKGKPFYNTAEAASIRDIISEPRREHSRKPEAFYTIVERLTTGKRIEIFSRTPRDGWEVWGNDTNKFQQEELSPAATKADIMMDEIICDLNKVPTTVIEQPKTREELRQEERTQTARSKIELAFEDL